MQPSVSLFYDSQSTIGPLGIGWSLAGLGQITRCNLTTAQDTNPAAVALVTSDGYCLNGKRLRLTGGTYGTAGSTYQTEIADFSNITATGTAGNGPEYFTVQGRNGVIYYYGYTDSNGNGANSEVLAHQSRQATGSGVGRRACAPWRMQKKAPGEPGAGLTTKTTSRLGASDYPQAHAAVCLPPFDGGIGGDR
jgi:hypothetical protein